MKLRPDANLAMKKWLAERFHDPATLGMIAETEGNIAGFLIGRIGDWESVPPLIERRRIGIIDAVHVTERFRRHGVGSHLIDRAVQQMRNANAVAVETIYDAWNDASAAAWHRAGFAPWMVHAYRML
jgi:GNAT superfamily N-acetyltransferase